MSSIIDGCQAEGTLKRKRPEAWETAGGVLFPLPRASTRRNCVAVWSVSQRFSNPDFSSVYAATWPTVPKKLAISEPAAILPGSHFRAKT